MKVNYGLTKSERDNLKKDFSLKRKCNKCQELKEFIKFPSKKEKNNLYYFSYKCSKCCYKKRSVDKEINNIYINRQREKENFTIEGRASMLRNRCKQRAKIYNKDFNLSIEKIIELLKTGICAKTNISLIMDDSKYNPYAPSIDRIDNNKGYTDDNIQITCMIYNFCKNQFTEIQVDDFIKKAKIC